MAHGSAALRRLFQLVVASVCAALCSLAGAAVPMVSIGVLTKGNEALTLAHWPPTAAYLEQHIPGRRFRIVPLDFNQIEPAVDAEQIDFLLANPAIFAEMEERFGASALLTLRRRVAGEVSAALFAGAIIVSPGRDDIQRLADLRGTRFAAVDPISFGGWAMAWRQLKHTGIDPFTDLARLEFLGSHEAVVRAVLNGAVDAGTVRSGVLEQMAAAGQLDLRRVRVLPEAPDHAHAPFGFPLLHSTTLYPEWPLASLPHSDPLLVKQVVLALLAMRAEDPAAQAAGLVGWQPPANYRPVHALMQDLKLAQYEHLGEIGLGEALRQHWGWAGLVASALLALLLSAAYALGLNLRQRQVNRALQAEMAAKAASEQALKARNQSVEENEQRLAAIVDNVLEAVVTSDYAGNIQTFNRAAETIFGYRQEEVLGRNVSLLMPAPDAHRHGRFISDYIRTGRAQIIGIGRESQGLRKNGEMFPIDLAVSEVSLRGQRMFVGIMRDLTDRKAHEARRRQVEKLEAVSKMAGGFAHEFNNLLSSIVGYTDMLLLDLADAPDRAADLGRVMEAAGRAKLLVKQLLDISRSDYEEALVLMPQKIVEEVSALLRGLLPEGAGIHCQLDQSPRQIRLPPFKFQQIIMNLGMHAIGALDQDGRIDIALEFVTLGDEGSESLAAGDYAVLSVCDNGGGIAPERLATLFEPNFTNHDAVTEQLAGLAAVNGIVGRYQGTIRVDNEPGRGSCFRVYLPCTA